MVINYKEEVNKALIFQEDMKSNYWKPEAGQYKVKSLGELYEIDPYTEEGKEPKPRVALDIEINGVKLVWTMGIGKTMKSTYLQLCDLAKETGTLVNVIFTVVVKHDGNKPDYTIVV